LIGNAAGGINRGVAVAGSRVFMVTGHANAIALDRQQGESGRDHHGLSSLDPQEAQGDSLRTGNIPNQIGRAA
jgi:hypothetical protein